MTGVETAPPARPDPEPADLEFDLPEPAADDDGLDDVAGLFGATGDVTVGFHPVPVVTIAGVDVARGPSEEAVRPAPGVPGTVVDPVVGALSEDLLVVDGLSITWGREDPLDQPEPATGRLTLFDASGSWATSLDLRGQSVVLSYAGQIPGQVIPVRRAFFRGRVGSPVKVTRKKVRMPDGTVVEGALVDLPLVSTLIDLANRKPAEAWPEETLGNRRNRLQTATADVLPGGIVVRDYWTTPNVAPVAAANQVSLYDHVVALYDSTGADRLAYDPDVQRLVNVERRDFPSQRYMAGLWWDTASETTQRAGTGVYARALGRAAGTYLDANETEYGAGITQPPRVTRVELVHPSSDPAWNYGNRTAVRLVAGTYEKRDGVRTARLESTILWNAWADVAAKDLSELVAKEGAAWRMEPLRWSSGRVAGFDSYAQGAALLAGMEQLDPLFFIQRSWLVRHGLRPIFGVMGQTMTYRREGWELELVLGPITTTLAQHAIAWEEIDDGTTTYEVQWHDDDHPRGLHASLTYEDIGFVSRGLAVNTTPTDKGWDTYH